MIYRFDSRDEGYFTLDDKNTIECEVVMDFFDDMKNPVVLQGTNDKGQTVVGIFTHSSIDIKTYEKDVLIENKYIFYTANSWTHL